LRLDNNFIQGPLPSALGDLGSLGENAHVVIILVGCVANTCYFLLVVTEILRIESNDVHGAIPSEIGNAVNLQYLHLWSK
jgi:hypothetical protein